MCDSSDGLERTGNHGQEWLWYSLTKPRFTRSCRAAREPSAGPLRHSDEKALVGVEAVHRLQILAFGGVLPCQVRKEGPAEIRHVLAQRQLAVDFDVVHDGVLRILIGNAFGALL